MNKTLHILMTAQLKSISVSLLKFISIKFAEKLFYWKINLSLGQCMLRCLNLVTDIHILLGHAQCITVYVNVWRRKTLKNLVNHW